MRILYFLIPLCFCMTTVFADGFWEEMSGTGATQKHHPVTFTINDTAYMLTGSDAISVTDDFYRYNQEEDNWENIGTFPGGARSYAYGREYDGKGYVGFGATPASGGGFDELFNDLWKFDPETHEWTELEPCECSGRAHPAFIPHDGKIYVGLGQDPSDRNDWWEYDIEEEEWTEKDPMPAPGRHHPYHFQAGDHVYAGMGHSGFNYFDDWFKFNTETKEWEEMNDHPGGPRVAGQEFSYNGKGYVISGDSAGHSNYKDGEFWEYHPEDDKWIRLADHPGNPPSDDRMGRWAPGAFVLEGYAYFFGGVNRNDNYMFNDLWRYQLGQQVSIDQENFEETMLAIYPNPAQDHITIETEHYIDEIKVFNTQGSKMNIDQPENDRLDISHLNEGLYFIKTRDKDGNWSQSRFIKE